MLNSDSGKEGGPIMTKQKKPGNATFKLLTLITGSQSIRKAIFTYTGELGPHECYNNILPS